jgi:hypothetical protein
MRTMTFFNGIFLSAICLFAASSASLANGQELSDTFSQTGFVLRETAVFSPVAADPSAALSQPFTRPAGTEIAILGALDSSRYGVLVHVGLDVNPEEGLPSDFWVRASDVPSEILEPYAPGEDSDFSILKKMTYCYRYVKQYLLQTGKVSTYLPGESAWMAAGLLPKYGFRRTGHTPANAVNGEVCVYSGGPQGHGHIEVKRNGAWWYGYGYLPRPMQGRKFIACFYK